MLLQAHVIPCHFGCGCAGGGDTRRWGAPKVAKQREKDEARRQKKQAVATKRNLRKSARKVGRMRGKSSVKASGGDDREYDEFTLAASLSWTPREVGRAVSNDTARGPGPEQGAGTRRAGTRERALFLPPNHRLLLVTNQRRHL